MGLRRVGDRPVGRVFVEPVLGAHTPEVESAEGESTEGGLVLKVARIFRLMVWKL